MAPRGKVVRSTSEQINRLVDYMSINRLFACNEYTGPHALQRTEGEWVRLKSMLAAYGPDKSVDQWKHTWRDLRKKAREEAIRARVAQNNAVDGGVVPELTENNKKILLTIGENRANVENGAGYIHEQTLLKTAQAFAEQDFEYVSVEPDVEVMEPQPPRRRRARVPRPAAPAPSPHSAALVRAQMRTNRILQDIAIELRTAARHRKRERMKGGAHFLKF